MKSFDNTKSSVFPLLYFNNSIASTFHHFSTPRIVFKFPYCISLSFSSFRLVPTVSFPFVKRRTLLPPFIKVNPFCSFRRKKVERNSKLFVDHPNVYIYTYIHICRLYSQAIRSRVLVPAFHYRKLPWSSIESAGPVPLGKKRNRGEEGERERERRWATPSRSRLVKCRNFSRAFCALLLPCPLPRPPKAAIQIYGVHTHNMRAHDVKQKR